MAMGSHPDRTVFVHAGRLRPISDLTGRHVIVVEKGRPWQQEIADRLRTAKCGVDTDHHPGWEKEGADLENAGARADPPASERPVAPASADLDSPDEQALLFRVDVERRCRDVGYRPITLKLREERLGSGLDEVRLAAELKKMEADDLIDIVSEAGTVFVVKRRVQRLTVTNLTSKRGW
jgi:hypothetical protein